MGNTCAPAPYLETLLSTSALPTKHGNVDEIGLGARENGNQLVCKTARSGQKYWHREPWKRKHEVIRNSSCILASKMNPRHRCRQASTRGALHTPYSVVSSREGLNRLQPCGPTTWKYISSAGLRVSERGRYTVLECLRQLTTWARRGITALEQSGVCS